MIDFFSLRTNSEFQMSSKFRDYAINDYWMARAGLWRLTQGVYDKVGSIVYEKVVDLVKKQHQKAYALLREHRQKLDEIAQYLYEKETISGEEFMRILNA